MTARIRWSEPVGLRNLVMTFDLRLRGRPLMVMRPVRTRESARRGSCGVVPRCRQVSGRGVAAVRRPQVHGPVRAMLVSIHVLWLCRRP